MIIGTWNTRSLYRTGALKELITEINKYKINILAVQETRWTYTGTMDVSGYTIFNSGPKSINHEHGVAFIVHQKLKTMVLDFKPIDKRMCVLRVKTKFFNISLINIHAETEDKDEEVKDAFYSQLARTYEALPSNDIKIVIGDFNAKIGKEEMYEDIIGHDSLHDISNDNGRRAIEFATMKNMVVSSTRFPRRDIHKRTWTSPNGDTHNQIDHIMIDRRNASSVMNVRTYRGANCDSDHYLVGMRYRCRISSQTKRTSTGTRRFDVGKLKQPETTINYQEAIARMLQEENNTGDTTVQNEWDKIKQSLLTAAEETIGYEERTTRNQWFDDECSQVIQMKNRNRKNFLDRPTRAKRTAYEESRRLANRIIKSKKREYNNNIILNIDEDLRTGNTRQGYREIRFIKQGYRPKCSFCKDTEGKILSNPDDIMTRWRDHFKLLLNPDNEESEEEEDSRQQILVERESEVEPPSIDEIQTAIQKLKSGKSPGKDNLSAEFFRAGGTQMIQTMHRLILMIWNKEEIPKEWNSSVICPIHKKGDKMKCENHRGISLLNVAYKIFTSVLRAKIEPFAENILGEYQAGFRRGRSTVDQIHVVRQVGEKFWEYNVNTYQLFIDFKQAYDSINRSELINILVNFNIPTKLVRLVKLTMENTVCQVKVGRELGQEFKVTRGLKQGDGLAPVLFNLTLESVIRKCRVDVASTLLNKSIQITGYADDLNIMARSVPDLKEAFSNIISATRDIGLVVNENKTKLLVQSRRNSTQFEREITIDGYNFEAVSDFIYLGSNMSNSTDETIEVKRRMNNASKVLYSVMPILKSGSLHRNNKIRIYKSVIRPVLTYGGETWTLTARSANMLDNFERKILRKIYGPVKDGEEWRIRMNHEIYKLYREPSVSTCVRLMRLRWAGHIQRMPEYRIPKKLARGEMEGKRPVGKPKQRWEDNVKKDALEMLGIRNWKESAKDRDEWRRKIEEAKARHGLQRHQNE